MDEFNNLCYSKTASVLMLSQSTAGYLGVEGLRNLGVEGLRN